MRTNYGFEIGQRLGQIQSLADKADIQQISMVFADVMHCGMIVQMDFLRCIDLVIPHIHHFKGDVFHYLRVICEDRVNPLTNEGLDEFGHITYLLFECLLDQNAMASSWDVDPNRIETNIDRFADGSRTTSLAYLVSYFRMVSSMYQTAAMKSNGESTTSLHREG